jgi:hypothetical protein
MSIGPEPQKQPRYRERIDDGYIVIDGVNFTFGNAPFFTTKPAALEFIESRSNGRHLCAAYIIPLTKVSSELVEEEPPQQQQLAQSSSDANGRPGWMDGMKRISRS